MQETFYAVLVAHMAYFNKSRKWQHGDFVPREGDLTLFLWTDALKKEFRLGLVQKLTKDTVFIEYPHTNNNGKIDHKIAERSPRDMVVLHRKGDKDHNTVRYWFDLYKLDGSKLGDIEDYFPEENTKKLLELGNDN